MDNLGGQLGDGRFQIRSLLGAGAMGRVYRAFDARLERDVALKMLAGVDAEERYLLKREFRAVADFSHPSVVQLYELFVDGETCYFTMQLVEGESLLAHVRGAAPPGQAPSDVGRARALRALAEVGEGLVALHASGHLHRDVKPANVRVARDGRAILLDFGLATPGRRSFEATRGAFYGTPSYAAPEQIFGSAEPASDWYGLGASLFELLTGELPAAGGNAADGGGARSPRPSDRAPVVDPELDELVASLLAADPSARPPGEAVVSTLDRLAGARVARRAPAPQPVFVGREDARRRLHEALARSRTHACVVWLRGPSGIGKSELALDFLAERRAAARARVLAGRCQPRESVAFRSLDPLVDDLSRQWLELAPDEARMLVPEHAGALRRVFPVLARVPAVAAAAPAAPVSDDELLRRATGALRDVLAAFAARAPLAVWIDDAQWGDRSSVALLRSLLRPPDAPRALVLVSHRSEEEARWEPLARLREALAEDAVASEAIDLPPLADAEADALLRGCREAAGLDAAQRAAVVASAGGSPFLLLELARHLEAGDTLAGPGQASELLARRLASLSGEARLLLEMASLAGRPFRTPLLLGMAGLGAPGLPVVAELCTQSLLRSGGSEAAEELEPYHDRIREAALAGLAPDQRRLRHRRIAEGLSAAGDAEAGLLVEHWMGAGEDARAADLAVRAGEEAGAALAFDRAADFYGLALRLRGSEGSDWSLQERRAGALADAGRSGDAGEAYERAAAARRAAAPDAAAEAGLLGRAAEQYLYAGRGDEGMARASEVMRYLRIPVPPNAAAAGRRANWKRLGLLLARDPGANVSTIADDPRTREHLAMLFGCAKGTALLFPKLSDYLGVLYLREALAAGDAEHVGIGLAKEASIEGALPGSRWRARGARLLATAHTVAQRLAMPHVTGTVLTCEAAYAYFCAEWERCVRVAEQALDVFRNQCVGESESLSITITFLMPALLQRGELRRMRELLPGFLDDAQRRGDLTLARATQAGDASVVVLAGGDVDAVMASAERLRALPTSRDEASLPYHYALATWRASLYRGDVADAWRRFEAAWGTLRDTGMLSFEVFSVRLRALRAGTAIALAAAGGGAGAAPSRLAKLAANEARRLDRSQLAFAAPWASVLRAGLATLRLDDRERAAQLARARAGFARAGMPLHAHAAALLDASADATTRDAALAFLVEQGVREPARLAGALLPGVAAGSS